MDLLVWNFSPRVVSLSHVEYFNPAVGHIRVYANGLNISSRPPRGPRNQQVYAFGVSSHFFGFFDCLVLHLNAKGPSTITGFRIWIMNSMSLRDRLEDQGINKFPLLGFQAFVWKKVFMAIYNDFLVLQLKYGSQEKVSFWCRCSIFLSPTFVEIKKSFTKMLLSFNFKNFRIFFSWKKTDKSEPM